MDPVKYEFEFLKVDKVDGVGVLSLSRPKRSNAINPKMWTELGQAADLLDSDSDVRVVLVKGEGKNFCAGADFELFQVLFDQNSSSCEARKREKLLRNILALQESFTRFERCRKPVIAAIHGACIGGAIDLITCFDFRYCSKDAYFSVKEIDLAITADIGTLQRLPKIVGEGVTRELAFSGRKFLAQEALEMKLVNKVFDSSEEMFSKVMEIAKDIASKSPITLAGIKQVMNYSRNHSVEDGLRYVATWNSGMLMSEDLQKAIESQISGSRPVFSKL